MTEVELDEGSLHMMNLLKYLIQQYTGLLFLRPDYISYISYLKADIRFISQLLFINGFSRNKPLSVRHDFLQLESADASCKYYDLVL
jgi:hypothetical protein